MCFISGVANLFKMTFTHLPSFHTGILATVEEHSRNYESNCYKCIYNSFKHVILLEYNVKKVSEYQIRIIVWVETSFLKRSCRNTIFQRRGGLSISAHQTERPMTLRPRLRAGLPFQYTMIIANRWQTVYTL